jgi:beta-N-acetylhexosaminidase
MSAHRSGTAGKACLMVGFEGTSLPPSLRARIADGSVGGVVLFSRNVGDARHVRDLCRSIRAAAGGERTPLIAIDHEGGRVIRLSHPDFTQFPPARACALFEGGAEAVAEEAGRAMARELRAVGIDITFSPVLDVDSNPLNPVIGDRAFSDRPEEAARLGIAFARGTRASGVIPVGKHFPGHGNTESDSHFELPVVRSARRLLESRDLLPFREAIRRGIPALMTAHVLYPALDRKRIATLSPEILVRLLRREMGFRGVVFSDALEMKAIADRYPAGESAVLAVAAGCDVVLVCRGEADQDAAVRALAIEAERSAAFRERVSEASRRVRRLARAASKPVAPRPTLRTAGCRAHRALAQLLSERWRDTARASAAGRSGNIGED